MEEFIRYCERHSAPSLPSSPQTVAEFLSSVVDLGIKSTTIRRKISSISAIHQLSNLPDPTKDAEVRIAMRKIYRKLGRNPSQAYGITRPILEKLLAVTTDDLRGKRDRALLLIAYDSLRRRSELISLRVEDIEWHDDSASIMLRRSKTDQYGSGKWLNLGNEATTMLKEWFQAAGISDGFILRGVTNKGTITNQLSGGQISRIYKQLAYTAGIEERVIKHISGHSLRVGAAQDLLVQGASLPQIMVKGGWMKTDTVMRYIERVRPDTMAARCG